MALVVRCWWFEEEKGEIEKWYLPGFHMKTWGKRGRQKPCEYEKVSEGLFLWFVQQRDEGRHIRVDNCTSFTRKIAAFLQGFNEEETDCTANIDWIGRWGKKVMMWAQHLLRERERERERGEEEEDDSEAFLNLQNSWILTKSEGVSHKQPSACNETGWKFKMLQSVVAKKNQLQAMSEAKNELLFLVYWNIKNRKSAFKM
jgi:hypothetical protein